MPRDFVARANHAIERHGGYGFKRIQQTQTVGHAAISQRDMQKLLSFDLD
jgi:hypothetical protein